MARRRRRGAKRAKTLSRQGQIGQRGVNLIERIVLEMGSRWIVSGPNEVGIDGYIELFQPESGEPLGLTLAVQSKVVNDLAKQINPTFDYYCEPADVEYWLNGNTPVVLVVSSPDASLGYWLSVKDAFTSWKRGTTAKVTFDRSKDQLTAETFRALASLAAPQAGLYLPPIRRRENIYSNLLAVRSFPETLFVAGTDCRRHADMWALLRETSADGAWCLWEKKVFSFHDLSSEPWSRVCNGDPLESFPTTDWSESNDPDRQRVFVQLLNATLREQVKPTVRYWPYHDAYAMQGRPRKLSYAALKRSSSITAVTRKTFTDKEGKAQERFRHIAFRGQFRRLDGAWYLEITPTYRFTYDGLALDHYHEDRLKGIKQLEGNRAVLSGVMFWADYLKPKVTLFSDNALPIQFGELLQFTCEAGIDDEAWRLADPTLAPPTAESVVDDLFTFLS